MGVGKYRKVRTKNRLDFSHHRLSHLRYSHLDLDRHPVKAVVPILD